MSEDTQVPARSVVAVVNDLMFGSKIRAAAQQLDVPLSFARNADSLREQAPRAWLLLLDLNTRWLNAPEEIRALKADPATQHLRIVAFGSHLAAEALTAARAAGADRVMANSAFVQVLPNLLRTE